MYTQEFRQQLQSDITLMESNLHITLTDLERQVLRNIVKSDYQSDYKGSGNIQDVINYEIWSFDATDSKKTLAGALGSLVKKGFAGCDHSGDPDGYTCWITEAGLRALDRPEAEEL